MTTNEAAGVMSTKRDITVSTLGIPLMRGWEGGQGSGGSCRARLSPRHKRSISGTAIPTTDRALPAR
jgi:hypothetical protein